MKVMLEKKNTIYVVLGLVVAAVAIVIVVDVISPESRIRRYGVGRGYRNEMKQFISQIPLGTPESQLQAAYDSGKFEHISLVPAKTGGYSISPPVAHGMQGWTLKVGVSGGVVVSVRVREYAHPDSHPFTAPKDQAYDGY